MLSRLGFYRSSYRSHLHWPSGLLLDHWRWDW